MAKRQSIKLDEILHDFGISYLVESRIERQKHIKKVKARLTTHIENEELRPLKLSFYLNEKPISVEIIDPRVPFIHFLKPRTVDRIKIERIGNHDSQ